MYQLWLRSTGKVQIGGLLPHSISTSYTEPLVGGDSSVPLAASSAPPLSIGLDWSNAGIYDAVLLNVCGQWRWKANTKMMMMART
jgi:hypothetical protein